jgi:hypothetical protein
MQDQSQPHDASAPRRSGDNLAEYNIALGKFTAFPRNLVETFTDVLSQIYPLTANMSVLQQFCDSYLNFPNDVEPPPVRFKPSAPIVMLEVVDYGSVASNTPGAGWFAQHEIAFGLPLDWQVRENSQWITRGSAYIYPYIYVDNPLSVAGGRQIYGWSKAPVIFESVPPIFQPTGARRLLNVALAGLGRSEAARGAGKNYFSVWQEQPQSSIRTALPDMLTIVPRALTASINAAFDFIGARSTAPANHQNENITALRSLVTRLYGNLDSMMQRAQGQTSGAANPMPATSQSVSIITLKQVRDVPVTALSCFQGIIESPMKILRIKDAGLLVNRTIPDLSGGITIRIADIQEQPVVQKLGIDYVPALGPHGIPEFRVSPLFPFWTKMDLTYGLADFQAWRTNLSTWTTNNTPQYRPGGASQDIEYVELGSGADQEVPGPFTFPKVTMRIFPLRAKRAPLQGLIDKYLGNTPFKFALTGEIPEGEAVVLAILSDFEGMRTPTRSQLFSDTEFTLAIPVVWSSRDDIAEKHFALIPAYSFVGKEWNTDTSVEAYGRLSMTSDFVDKGTWPRQIPPSVEEPIVTIKSELFAEPLATEEARMRPVFEFISKRTDLLERDVEDSLTALGLPNLIGSAKIPSIALKQVRDANDPAKADYQSIVHMERLFEGAQGDSGALLASKNQKITIKAYEYPTMPIIKLLGLDAYANWTQQNGFVKYILEPVDAFYVRGSLSDERTKNLAVRVGKNNPWRT